MNKSYRLIWNEIAQTWVAAAETAKGHGKRSSGAVLLAAAGMALAVASAMAAPPNPPAPTQLPTGGQVVAGQAAIVQSAATLNINQSTNRAAIDWATFNVGAKAQVNFNQPGTSSVTLNRVLDSNPSQIFGRITAPGQVFLTNPSGMYFAPGASVDVGGLVATTHSISNADFMAGGSTFTRNGATGSIVNEGTLTANHLGGYIALLAPEVRNQGVIVAQMGTVALAAGEAYELQFDGNNALANIRVAPATIAALVENGNVVQAPGGLVILSARAADQLRGSVVRNSGAIEAKGLVDKGGRILLEGDHITLASGSTLDASGATGGGDVLVGGDRQGSGSMYQATTVTMEQGATIDASATQQGNGGTAVLWATGSTDFAGNIFAKGAGLAGAGGNAEVSGKTLLNYTGQANLLGSQGGSTGTLLLDPYNLYVVSGSGGSVTASGNNSILGVSTLTSQLTSANVVVSTGASGTQSGIIGVMTDITAPANNLTLTAAGNVVLDGNVSMGGLLTVNAGGNFVMGTNLSTAAGVTIAANGGFVKTGTGTSYLTGNITTSGRDINITGPVQIANFNGGVNPLTLSTGGANISLSGTVSNYSGTAQNYAVLMASNLYDGVSASAVAGSSTDVYLNYSAGSNLFLSQLGLPATLNYLLVGGGGGGGTSQLGSFTGGGGGGGGATSGSYVLSGSSTNITIGASGGLSSHGGDSALGTLYVGGGGGGGNYNASVGQIGYGNNNLSVAGRTYVAGGGGGGAGSTQGNGSAGGTGTAQTGGTGGASATPGGCCTNTGGGGGGATASAIFSGGQAVTGGAGYSSSITGTSIVYGAGGSVSGAAVANTGGGGGSQGYGTFAGANGTAIVSYTVGSASTSGASALKLSAGSGSVTLGSSVSNLSSLEVNAGAASSITGAISGTGSTLTNSGAGALTLTGAATYTGSTAVTSSGIVFSNNAPPTTTGFTGAGTITIQPSTSFTSAFTPSYTYASTLTGLTLGSVSNTADITVGSAISIAGPISIYGGTITLNSNLASTASGAAILLSATSNIATSNTAAKTITTNNGNISLIGDANAVGVGALDLDYETLSAGTGNVLVRGKTFGWTVSPTASPTITSTTGTFTFESSDASFGQGVDVGWFNLPSTLSGLTIGKSTNTQNVDVSTNSLNVAGPISIYGGNVTLNAALSGAGDITAVATTTDLLVNAPITNTSASASALLLKAGRHVSLGSTANITSTTAAMNSQLWADSDNSGDGIIQLANSSISTQGGWLKFGNNQTASINGSNVLVGGDVFFNGTSAQTLATGGGSLNIYGETILANASGVTINTSGGNVAFSGVLNSGNQYSYVDGPDNAQSWTWARTDAKNSTAGGSATGDSYLVTITSRLENAIAGLTAGYRGAWIGAWRANPGSSYAWTWADGPEAGKQFFTQNSSGGSGTTTTGYYSNYGTGEPNGGLNGESVGQFYGSAGQWNDLAPTTTFAATQLSPYSVLGYVRETNLASTALTINAGSGAVVFNNAVGASKALASLTVNAASTAVNGTALVTTGAQNYNNALTVTSTGDLNVAATTITVSNANQGLLLKAAGSITDSANLITNGGAITLWADSDASQAGFILLSESTTLDSRTTAARTANVEGSNGTTASGGADITLGGGNGATAAAGYAVSDGTNANQGGVNLGDQTSPNANRTNNTIIYSGGGNILVRGKQSGSGSMMGINWVNGGTINAGTGTVTLDGQSGSGHAIELSSYRNAGLAKIYTSGGSAGTAAISITGITSANNRFGLLGAASLQANGAGGISLTGNSTGNTGGANGITLSVDALAASGPITLDGGTYGISLGSGSTLGKKTGTNVTTSTSNITLTANVVAFSGATTVDTTGTLTVQPYSTSFSSALSWPVANLTLVGGISGLTLGKAGNTADITVASATSIAGPINIFGGNITINSGATLTSTAGTQGILLKATGGISDSANLTTSGGDITLWANSAGAATGGIQVGNGVTLSSTGGWITLGGSANNATISGLPTTSTNGTTLPQGYAENMTGTMGGVTLGTYIGGTGQNAAVSINSGNGNISIAGQSTIYASNYSYGVNAYSGVNVNSGSGNITVNGLSTGATTNGYDFGFSLANWFTNGTNALSKWQTAGGTITLNGTASGATSTGGVNVGADFGGSASTTSTLTIEDTATGGGITVNGSASGAASNNTGIRSATANILSKSGAIALNANTAGNSYSIGAYTATLGSLAGSDVTASSANITVTADALTINGSGALNINTTGALTVQPYSTSFTSALSWPVTNLTLASTISGLTLGKAGNTADITVGSDTSIAGPISIYGGNINLNANLTSTLAGAAILAKASGNITTAASKTFLTNNGDLIFWSNSGNLTSGATVANIVLGDSTTLNSANGSLIATSGGGNIYLAGGSGTSTPTGYAYGTGVSTKGVWIGTTGANQTAIYSGGGNIVIAGQSASATGVVEFGGGTVNAGGGTISIQGISGGGQGVEWGANNSNATNNSSNLITSSSSATLAISMTGSTTGGYGIQMGYYAADGGNNSVLIEETGTGGVSLTGTGAGAGNYGVQLNAGAVLASSGAIAINGGTGGVGFNKSQRTSNFGTVNLGQAATASLTGSLVTSSSSSITITGDVVDTATTNIGSTGTLTVQPYGNSFSSAVSTAGLTLDSGITGLALGKDIGNTAHTDTITMGSAASIAGPISIYGGNITIGGNLTSIASGAAILVKASGNIVQASGVAVATNAGDVTYWADSDAGGTGAIRLQTNASVASTGGNVFFGGGTALSTGFAASANDATNGNGVELSDGATVAAVAGNVTMHGSASHDTGSYSDGVRINGAGSAVSGGNITLIGQGSTAGANYTRGVAIGNGASVTGSGVVAITGTGGAITGTGNDGVAIGGGGGGSSTPAIISATGTGSVTIVGTGGGTGGSTSNDGINILSSANGSAIIRTASGALQLTGTAGVGSGSQGIDSSGVTLGQVGQSGNTTLNTNSLSATGSNSVLGSGALTIQSLIGSDSFDSAITTSNLSLDTTLTGLTIGKTTNTADITVGSATSIAGPISVYGGNIAINAALTASGTNTIWLYGSGNVTDGASGYLAANKLALMSGNVTLDNASNNIGTLAASGVSGLTYVNSNALTIGTVGSTIGVSATGVVGIGTATGDLTLAQNVATTDATASALVLNAGISTAAGTATGGNIVVTSGKTVTVGAGGTAKLYTGSVSGSTNLAAMTGLGSGSGRFRYNSDEATTNFTNSGATALGTGLYAIYRESPSATGTVSSATITYGDATPTFTLSGGALQNGDGASGFTIVSAAYSTANKLKASGTPYAVSTAGLSGLGYNVSGVTNGALTVNTKTLTLAGFAAAGKTYDGNATATISNAGSLSGLESGDLVTVSNTGATFANKNVGIGKTVTLNGVALASSNGNADAANYTVASTTASADVIALGITLTAAVKTKIYGETDPALTYSGSIGLASGDAYSGALTRATGENVATCAINQGTLAINDGNSGNNYTVTYVGNNLGITARPINLTATASQSKIYGNTDPTLAYTAEVNSSGRGLVGSDTFSGAAARAAGDNVGTTYAINQGTLDNSNYAISFTGNNFAITARPITIAATTGQSKVYGNTDPTLAYILEANGSNRGLVGSDTFSGALTRAAGENVSATYAINQGTLDNSNYAISFAGNNFAVTQRAITLAATAASRTYGAVDPGLAVSVTGGSLASVAVSDTLADVTGTLTRQSGANVGSYDIALGTGAKAGNYSISFVTDNNALTINPKTVSLSGSKTYDGTAALTGAQVTVATGVGAETLTYTGATANDAHLATVGKYINAITLADATDGSGGLASNYALPTLNAANAAVTINAATLTPTLSNTGVTKVYDGTTNTPAGFTPTWSFAGLASGETAAALAYTGAAYNDANVANANKVTVSGISLSGITGGNNSAPSDYVLNATSKDAVAGISKATLAVSANNDAKFVTQADTTNFAGISYSGFVNGETSGVLGGTATVTRTNAGTQAAGAYAGVLQAGGLTSGNYQFSYANGDFTITPSNQLLVRVNDVSNSYGTVTQYAISSAEYWNGSAAVRLDNGSVSGSSVAVNASNQVTVNDGSAGIATFTVAPLAATFSTANKLVVGNYQIGTSGTVTENSSNFSNSITVVGSHQVNTKALTASASGSVSKTYDGTTSMSGVTLALTGKETNDLVTVSGTGAFTSKNASAIANQTYTVSNLALSDADARNYYLSGGTSFSGSNGQIIAKAVTLAPQAVTRDYNGVATYTPTASDINYLTALLGVSGDSVSAASVSFANKNVGTGKTLTVSAATVSDGNGGNNYTITLGSNSTSAITRLSSVTWVGPTSGGNWFDPANWAGGAVPDLSNVANVVIPNGSTPVFGTTIVAPAQSGTVNLDSIGTSGSLSQNGGALSLGIGGMTLNTFTQSGGTLNSTGPINLSTYSQTGGITQTNGDFTTTTDFSQGASGSVTVAGNTSITDTSGGIVIGNLNTTGTTSITSTGGDITQASGTSIVSGGATTLDASNGATRYNIVLDGAGNNFSTVNARGNAINLTDVGDLTVVLDASGMGTLNAGGNLTVSGITGGLTTTTTNGGTTSFGTTTVTGNLSTTSAGAVSQTGPLSVTGTTALNAAGQDVTLDNPANDFVGAVSATAQDLALADSNTIVLGNITTTGTLSVSAKDDITQTSTSVISATGDASLTSTSGNIALGNAGNDFSNVTASGTNVTLADANGINASVTASGNANLTAGGALTAALAVGGNSTLTAGDNLAVSGTTTDLTTTTTGTGTTSFGTTTVGGNLSATSAGAVSQTGALSVTGTSSFSATGQTITLENAANDFGGAVSANASSVSLANRKGLVLGNVTTTGNLTANAVNDITQSGGTSIQTGGSANINSSGGNATIPSGGGNNFAGGLTILDNTTRAMRAAAAKLAAEKNIPQPVVIPMPALPTPVNSPAPLIYVVSSGGGNLVQNNSAGADAGTGTFATPGISIDIQQVPTQDASGMISVLLPKGMATSGTAFTFPLPEEISASGGNAASIIVSLADGSPLPKWLRFDAQSRSFVAEAVQDGVLPIQVVVTVGGRKTMIVISERNE